MLARPASLDYAKPLQHDEELDQLIALLVAHDVRSYLEIGGRYGGSFERIMIALPQGSRGTVIDFPGGPFGDDNSPSILMAALDRLKAAGRDVNCIFGPSAAVEVHERAVRCSPFDAIVIDGDHSYDAVRRDFWLYRPLGRIIALHDIAAPDHVRSRDGLPVEVPRFWNEIKTLYKHTEIICDNSLMGIGVLFAPTR